MPDVRIAAFYKFVDLPNFESLRSPFLACAQKHEVYGTILLAAEGVNGTVAGPEAGVEALLNCMREDPRLADLQAKNSWADEVPFYRMKVRLKREIVTIGRDEVDPCQLVGTYVPAREWNALIQEEDVVLVDTRNDYEYVVGTFEGAINPKTDSFRDFPAWVEEHLNPERNQRVAMFCTGGIRCEKATSYLLGQGFKEVYHLDGGILRYLEEVPREKSLWRGECFVFDNRVTVDHELAEGDYELCPACRHAVSREDRLSEHYLPGVCCPNCHDTLSEDKKASCRERQKQMQLAKERGERHLGATCKSQKAE